MREIFPRSKASSLVTRCNLCPVGCALTCFVSVWFASCVKAGQHAHPGSRQGRWENHRYTGHHHRLTPLAAIEDPSGQEQPARWAKKIWIILSALMTCDHIYTLIGPCRLCLSLFSSFVSPARIKKSSDQFCLPPYCFHWSPHCFVNSLHQRAKNSQQELKAASRCTGCSARWLDPWDSGASWLSIAATTHVIISHPLTRFTVTCFRTSLFKHTSTLWWLHRSFPLPLPPLFILLNEVAINQPWAKSAEQSVCFH